jgi:hypothetical protein
MPGGRGTVRVLAILLAGCGGTPPAPPSALAAASASPTPVVISGESPIAPDPSAESSPTASPAATRSPRPDATPGPTAGPKPPYRRGADLVTLTDDLRLRSAPGVGPDSRRYEPLLGFGANILVREGPVKADGYWWYRVRLLDGLSVEEGIDVGWLAAQDHDGEEWIGFWPDEGIDTGEVYEPPFPSSPVLTAPGVETVVRDGVRYANYRLSIANWREYAPELFEPGDYGPCDGEPTRTWVEILDADYRVLHTYCSLRGPRDLTQLVLSVREGDMPPDAVSVLVWDRVRDYAYESSPVDLPRSPFMSPSPS